MRNADALSRMYYLHESTVWRQMKAAQSEDEEIQDIIRNLNETKYADYVIENELLCKKVDHDNLIVVPKLMQHGILRKIHDQGHFSQQKMEKLIKRKSHIPQLHEKMRDVVQNCIQCILAERKGGKAEGMLHPIPKYDLPLDTWHMDHLGMSSTNKNYQLVLAIVDAFTKFVWIFPTKSTTAADTLGKLKILTNIFDNPRRIITDKGTAFTAEIFQQHCPEERIELTYSTTGVPRGNGQVEKMNQTIIASLSKTNANEHSGE